MSMEQLNSFTSQFQTVTTAYIGSVNYCRIADHTTTFYENQIYFLMVYMYVNMNKKWHCNNLT